jgi:ribose transport system permease protein
MTASRESVNPGGDSSADGTALSSERDLPNAEARSNSNRRRSLSGIGADYGVLISLVILIVAFSSTMPGQFATLANVRSMLNSQAISGILALAVVLPLAAGEFDLSVGANLGFCSIVAAQMASHGWPTASVVVISLAIGTAIGVFNSILIVGIRVNAFIATLGVSTILAGMNLWVTNGATIFQNIGPPFTLISTEGIGGLQFVVIYFIIIAVVLWYALEKTPYGRYLRATGLGRDAARLSGVRTNRYLVSAFIIAGLLAGASGVLQTALYGSAPPSIGPEFLLPAYAAAFLGAATIRRGMFNVWGTVVGLLILAVGINGLTLAGAPFWVPSVFNGLALIIAVSASVILSRREPRPSP